MIASEPVKKKRPYKQNIMVAKHFLENTPCAIAKYKQANQTCAYHELFELQIYTHNLENYNLHPNHKPKLQHCNHTTDHH